MTVREVTVDDLAALVADVDAQPVIFDVREPDEYVSGHVPGAVNIPLGSVPENVVRMSAAPVVYVVCQAGGRSMTACRFLAEQSGAGETAFVNVAGGTGGWLLAGHGIVVGDQPR